MVSNDYQPLQITANLRSPVVADEWLPLDGLLLYQSVRRDLGPRDVTISGASTLAQPKGEKLRGGRLPIKIVHAKDWYYRCSWAEWGPHVDGIDYWNKRFDMAYSHLVNFGGRRGVVNHKAAKYKAYHMPIYYRSALWVRWYCVGDKDKIERLLSTMTHIGKKTAQGWGRIILPWRVESVDEDWSIWKDGELMRGIPIYHKPRDYSGRRANYGIRPSYWDHRNQMELVVP